MINLIVIVLFASKLQPSSLISGDDLKNFGYQMGLFEGIRATRQSNFLVKNGISMEEGYQKIFHNFQDILTSQVLLKYFLDGCSQTEKSLGSYNLIKTVEKSLEESFSKLQSLDRFEENSLLKKEYLFKIIEQIGIWQGGELIYNDHKSCFNFLKNYLNPNFEILILQYEEGKQVAMNLKFDELLIQYKESGQLLMKIYHNNKNFFPEKKSMFDFAEKMRKIALG